MSLLFEEKSYNIIGAAMAVHKELGQGFLEAVYQEAMEKEFSCRNIPFTREALIPIYYKKEKLKKSYIADFICYNEIIVELKALSALTSEHQAQLINYLTATRLNLGILFNFGKTSLEYKRIVNEKSVSIRENPRTNGETE
jgi:GxxExxY protein